VGATVSALAADKSIQEAIGHTEQQLVRLIRDAGDEQEEWVAVGTSSMPEVGEIQEMLGDHEVLLEYYVVHGRFCVFVLSRTGFDVVSDLGSTDQVRECLKGLNFQLSKFHLSPGYLELHRERLLMAALHHLRDLYNILLKPVETWIEGRSLVVVPHHVLHYVPFHALHDGTGHVVDRHDLVYGASASVLRICRSKKSVETDEDLVLAVPDEATPSIRDEAETLRQLLPNARVFVGKDARADLLEKYGARAGRIHIAAHGVFRSDNPMFSSLQLGDSWLNLMDIFNLKLGADLTTLSACETGMSALYEGDELLGLTRSFLYAGTPSLVVSLWRVNDDSTTLLMKRFYEGLLAGETKARALQQAMIEIKQKYPHPYYWVPFILMGKS
jgi:CHAT domain-containing protein